MNKSTFHITKMDCAAEEHMIRMKLDSFTKIKHLDFDLPNRKLIIYHLGEIQSIHNAIHQLNLNDSLVDTVKFDGSLPDLIVGSIVFTVVIRGLFEF